MSGTQSILDSLTSSVMTRKAGAAVALTPVGRERNGPLDGKHEVNFPFDDPQTVHRAIINGLKLVAQMEEEAAHIREGLNALAALYGLVSEEARTLSAPTPTPVEPALTPEQQADAAAAERERVQFEQHFAEKSKQAQAAAFKPDTPPAPVTSPDGWVCPKHGAANTTELTSRRGRKYHACISCDEFERET
jgi:hypothetical protein